MCRDLRSRQQAATVTCHRQASHPHRPEAFCPGPYDNRAWLVLVTLCRLHRRWVGNKRGEDMQRQLAALLVSGALIATGGAAWAHHSFAMFNQEEPLELEGT